MTSGGGRGLRRWTSASGHSKNIKIKLSIDSISGAYDASVHQSGPCLPAIPLHRQVGAARVWPVHRFLKIQHNSRAINVINLIRPSARTIPSVRSLLWLLVTDLVSLPEACLPFLYKDKWGQRGSAPVDRFLEVRLRTQPQDFQACSCSCVIKPQWNVNYKSVNCQPHKQTTMSDKKKSTQEGRKKYAPTQRQRAK
ncbi:hypothetical protein CPC08DRAFT_723709 [Agrocybe pediades]|nr:hypothetical protein CPC08DRAFT_723709 [Agrocybe pediades]